MHEDEDEDDKRLVRPASRKEPAEKRRDPATDDEDLQPLVLPRLPSAAPVRKRNGPPVWQVPTATLEQEVSRDSRERAEDTTILGRKTKGEALRNIITKLFEERKDLHLKHYHMSTAEFKKRTTHMDIPVVKTCPFCNSVKSRPGRSRVSGLRAEEFGDLIFLDHGSAKNGNKTFRFLIVLDGVTPQLTAYPCKSTSPSEAIAKLHEWMDTFEMNPKAICADMAFHHPHDMQAYYQMHNVKRIPTGPHTPWPNRTEMGVRLFKKFFLALVDTASKNLDQTTLAQITPAQLMRTALGATLSLSKVTSRFLRSHVP